MLRPGVCFEEDMDIGGSAATRLALVLEYAGGGSLTDVIKAHRDASVARPTRDRMLEIMYGVARALNGVHASGMQHNDLKPDNVLITESGEVRLCDFGTTNSEGRVRGFSWDYGKFALHMFRLAGF